MRVFPAALERLTEQFAKLPGIGGKTAQRLAFYLLSQPQEEAEEFADALLEARRSVHLCPVCQNLTDRDICPICEDEERDHGLVCVVAEPKDVVAMERAREYHGVYHVLHGVISPLNQVGPDDLRIRELLERVGKGGVREVIMATNPDTEGEATAIPFPPAAPAGGARDAPCLRHSRRQSAGICRRGHASARARGQKSYLKNRCDPSNGPQRFFCNSMNSMWLSALFRGRTAPVCRGRSAHR